MDKVKVLFLGADPLSANPRKPANEQKRRLSIDAEMREIEMRVRMSEHRDSLQFVSRWAVRPDDLLQALNEVRPHIVHFSAHGTESGELILVGHDGGPHTVPRDALVELFRTLRDDIRVVFLNACYTRAQAEGIAEFIDCAIGMSTEVSDRTAITFAASFYRALGFGRSVQEAFDQGKVAVQMQGVRGHLTPQLLVRDGVDAAEVILVDPSRVAPPPADPPADPRPRTVHAGAGGIAIGGNATGSTITINHHPAGEAPQERSRKAGETLAVIRDELQRNLQRLASQITHTVVSVPAGNPVPRRPGETGAQFEDRDRDWFAREVEYVFSMYPQFALEDAVYASQRVNLPLLDERKRDFITRAHAEVDEVQNRVFLYRTRLQGLVAGATYDSRRRAALARLHSRQTANALAGLWFAILESWLMLEPDAAAVSVVRGILPQVLGGEPAPARLEPGAEGWRYANEQRARLHREKMALDMEETALVLAPSGSPADAHETPASVNDALGRASLAYLEGRAENAVGFLRQALRFPDVRDDQRHFAATSLAFLENPDAFGGALGAYLLEVEEGGTGERSGLRKGDVIIRYNGEPVAEPGVLSRLVSQARGAPSVAVEAVRDGTRSTVYVKGGASLCAIATALVYVESLAV